MQEVIEQSQVKQIVANSHYFFLEIRGYRAVSSKRRNLLVTRKERKSVDEYLTVKEVARLYGVTERTVRNWISEGKLYARRVAGHSIRIDLRSLDLLSEPVNYRGYTPRRASGF